MRPISHTGHEPLFQGVDVDVIHVRRVVLFIADRVLPESSLPNAALTLGHAYRRQAFGFRQCFGEGDLDCLPACRVIGVIGRQRPNGMHGSGKTTHASM